MARELKRIAYVEDEPDIRAVVELVLTTLGGVELDVSTDGAEALRRIPAFGPDLILLDVMMPGMHGPEVFRRLREMPGCAVIPVVFMTAKAQRQECDSYLDLGAAAVIPKPFDPMTLYDQLCRIWDGAGA
ncbi:response regulator [Thalassovita mangrovi]|uniref:Response regulator n=1 Tax=Thalassovita mangrovi TaxID=2692236 RepID=A0A6L8LQQ5_9RHOB|nr:response regulator [Thalassovita mangrovi]MYM57436.1 response regulator [Thalassovita mangrovi]